MEKERLCTRRSGGFFKTFHSSNLPTFHYYNPSGKAYHGLHFYYVCKALPGETLADRDVFDDSAEQPAWVEIERLRGEEFQVSGEKMIEYLEQYAKKQSCP